MHRCTLSSQPLLGRSLAGLRQVAGSILLGGILLAIVAPAARLAAQPAGPLTPGFYTPLACKSITGVTASGAYAAGTNSSGAIVRFDLRANSATILTNVLESGNAYIAEYGAGVAYGSKFYPLSGAPIPTGLTTVYSCSVDGDYIGGVVGNKAALSSKIRGTNTYNAQAFGSEDTQILALSSDGLAFGGSADDVGFIFTPSAGNLTLPMKTVRAMSADPYGLAYTGTDDAKQSTTPSSDYLAIYNGTNTRTIITLTPSGDSMATAMSGDWQKPIVVGSTAFTAQQRGFIHWNGTTLSANAFLSNAGLDVRGHTIYTVECIGVTSTTVTFGGIAHAPDGTQVGYVAVIPNTYGTESDQNVRYYWRGARAFAENDQLNGYLHIGYWAYYYYLPRNGYAYAARQFFTCQSYYYYLAYTQAGNPTAALSTYNYFKNLAAQQ